MMRSLHHLSRDSRQQTRRRHRHRPLEIQTLEERKLMTVAACVLPAEPAAIVMQNPANPVGANPVDANSVDANSGGANPGGANPGGGDPRGGDPVAGDQPGSEAGDQNGGSNPQQSSQVDQPIGTTVQLPTFAFTDVSTTVSVPDGGTVLLGGIKRLSGGRVECGVPLLNKIPYLSRLFRNVPAGQDSNSLMLMVTPRIIIQEEE